MHLFSASVTVAGVVVVKCSEVHVHKQGGSDAEAQQDVTGQVQGRVEAGRATIQQHTYSNHIKLQGNLTLSNSAHTKKDLLQKD